MKHMKAAHHPPTMSYRVTASKARCLLSGFSEPEMLDLGSL